MSKFFIRSFIAGALFALCAVPPVFADAPKATAAAADSSFAALADEFFDGHYFPTNPTTATLTGLHQYDTKIEDFSRRQVDREIAALEKFDTRFSRVDPKALDEMTRGDRALVLNYIHGRLLTLQTIRPWEKN